MLQSSSTPGTGTLQHVVPRAVVKQGAQAPEVLVAPSNPPRAARAVCGANSTPCAPIDMQQTSKTLRCVRVEWKHQGNVNAFDVSLGGGWGVGGKEWGLIKSTFDYLVMTRFCLGLFLLRPDFAPNPFLRERERGEGGGGGGQRRKRERERE